MLTEPNNPFRVRSKCKHQTFRGKLIPADTTHGPEVTYLMLKEQADIPHYMTEVMLYVLYVKKSLLFSLMQNCYLELHSIAFGLCMLCISEHEVPDISAHQQHQSLSSSATSNN